MIIEIFAALAAASLISLLSYLLGLAKKNLEMYQFFERNAPGLRVLENPSLFGGHTNHILKQNCEKGAELIEKYGPTFGMFCNNRPIVVTVDLDFIKTFILDEPNHINRAKAGLPIKEVEEDCIMFAEDDQWIRLRRAIAPAFSNHKCKLPNVQSDINNVIDKLVNLIDSRLKRVQIESQEKCAELDTEDVCHRFSLALLYTIFYKQPDVVDFSSDKDKFLELIQENIAGIAGFFSKACIAFPILQQPLNWLVLNFHGQGKMRNTIMDWIKQQTKQHFEAVLRQQQQGEKNDSDKQDITLEDGTRFRRNMIDHIIDQYRGGKLTSSEFFNSTFFLFFAAYATLADTLSRLLYNLANHPDVQEKLRESIQLSGTESEYLTWVLNETLRLHPPAPIGCSRVIKRDIQTKHGLVPAGTFVITPAYNIGRLKEYWGEDADEFRPERWANSKSFHPLQFVPFGAGRRACPGKELATIESKMLMNVVLRKYKLERSHLYPDDNSKQFISPLLAFTLFETPTYIRISSL